MDRILLFKQAPPPNPSKRLRVTVPLAFLAQRGYDVLALEEVFRPAPGGFQVDPSVLERVTALFLYITDFQPSTAEYLMAVVAFLRQAGKRVIVDTDDHFFTPVQDNLARNDWVKPFLPLFQSGLQAASLVSVTGKHLQEAMSAYNPNVLIVPILIDPLDYPLRKRAARQKVRIGWTGGCSHFQDLTMVLPAVRRVQEETGAEFVLFGLFQEPMDELLTAARRRAGGPTASDDAFTASFLQLAGALDGMSFQHIPAVPYDDYPRRLADLDLDIGLGPLRDTLFNRCRSALKFYQFAAVGTATLASDVYPYAGQCSYVAENTVDDWQRKLSALVQNEALRRSVTREQRRYVLGQRTCPRMIHYYEALVGAPGRP